MLITPLLVTEEGRERIISEATTAGARRATVFVESESAKRRDERVFKSNEPKIDLATVFKFLFELEELSRS